MPIVYTTEEKEQLLSVYLCLRQHPKYNHKVYTDPILMYQHIEQEWLRLLPGAELYMEGTLQDVLTGDDTAVNSLELEDIIHGDYPSNVIVFNLNPFLKELKEEHPYYKACLNAVRLLRVFGVDFPAEDYQGYPVDDLEYTLQRDNDYWNDKSKYYLNKHSRKYVKNSATLLKFHNLILEKKVRPLITSINKDPNIYYLRHFVKTLKPQTRSEADLKDWISHLLMMHSEKAYVHRYLISRTQEMEESGHHPLQADEYLHIGFPKLLHHDYTIDDKNSFAEQYGILPIGAVEGCNVKQYYKQDEKPIWPWYKKAISFNLKTLQYERKKPKTD